MEIRESRTKSPINNSNLGLLMDSTRMRRKTRTKTIRAKPLRRYRAK
jgi:hypothetical protein